MSGPESITFDSSIKFVLEITHRETGKTERRIFNAAEERIAAFSKLDVHTHSYFMEEI